MRQDRATYHHLVAAAMLVCACGTSGATVNESPDSGSATGSSGAGDTSGSSAIGASDSSTANSGGAGDVSLSGSAGMSDASLSGNGLGEASGSATELGSSSGSASGGSSGTFGSFSGTETNAGSPDAGGVIAPTGLLTNLLAHPENATLTDGTPKFSWIVNSTGSGVAQTAYRILVASSSALLDANSADMWDSGQQMSSASINVPYAGKALSAGATYFWKVQTWDSTQFASVWSTPQKFAMASSLGTYKTATEAVVETRVAPTLISTVGNGHYFVDFGLDAFGWIELTINAPTAGAVLTVNSGEKAIGQSVDLSPGATIRHAQSSVTLQQGTHTYRVVTPTDAPGIPPPASLGNIMPFRYLEILNSPVAISSDAVRQVAVAYPYDSSESSFSSSNSNLDAVWNFSKYTIFATTFADLYTDGDRERIPYEGDSYIHQRGQYSVNREFPLPRNTHEYLLTHPTWPTEWKQHSIFLAWTDWMYTGNTDSLAQAYNTLANVKLLTQYVGADGLLNTSGICSSYGKSCGPVVDWPNSERDGFVFTDVNTVVNAFYCRNLQQMADLATALGKTADAMKYGSMAAAAIATFNQKLFDTSTGLYIDGETTTHSSLHANAIPLALGLVPSNRIATVSAFLKSRGMACSVYGAQYLLEAFYNAGDPDAAVSLMTATTLTSWNNMLKVGATMTMEAWDVSLKSNLDWNHPWATAPANIVARYLLGVEPLTPGFASASIHPQLGSLTKADGIVPTIRGPIHVVLVKGTGPGFSISFTLPANMVADVALPVPAGVTCNPVLDGQSATAVVKRGTSWVSSVGSGQHELHCL